MGNDIDCQTSAEGSSWASTAAVRRVMQGNRSRDTKPELAVRRAVHAAGLRYRVCARPLPTVRRTADLVFRRAKVAVFVDGCFWHGCPEHGTHPKVNSQYWADKIRGNRARDAETTSQLRAAGWTVLRFWSHVVPKGAAEQIVAAVRGARTPRSEPAEFESKKRSVGEDEAHYFEEVSSIQGGNDDESV